MYSTAFWCLLSFYCFLALLRNRCYSFHRTKWRLVITSICRGPGPLATRMPFFFCRNSNPLQIFHLQPKRETFFLCGRSARKKIHDFLIKSSHLCRKSRHVWLSSSACDHCCACQLICTYTTCSQYKSLVDVSFPPCHPSCKC